MAKRDDMLKAAKKMKRKDLLKKIDDNALPAPFPSGNGSDIVILIY